MLAYFSAKNAERKSGFFYLYKVYFLYLVFNGFFCADARAVAVDMLEFIEESIRLGYVVFYHRGFAAVKITAKGFKTHGKSRSAHFNVAFSYCPKTAECFRGVGRHHNGALLHRGKESSCDTHKIVGAARVFNINAAFNIGNGANDGSAAVGKIEKFIGVVCKIRFFVFVERYFNIIYAKDLGKRAISQKLGAKKLCFCGIIARALDPCTALLGNEGELFVKSGGKLVLFCVIKRICICEKCFGEVAHFISIKIYFCYH